MTVDTLAVYPTDRRHRTSFLILVIVVFVVSIPISADAQKNQHGDTYANRADDNLDFFEIPKLTNVSSAAVKNSMMIKSMKSADDHRSKEFFKAVEQKSPALEKFLKDVLKAQNDLRWIDQVVRPSREKHWENSKRHGNKLRVKRSFGRSYGNIWRTNKNKYRDENIFPRRASFYNDMYKRDADFDDLNIFPHRFHKKEIFYDKGSANDQIPKEWIKTKDLCSLSDWLSSNKNPEIELDKSGDRWIQYQSGQQNMLNSLDLDKEASVKADARLNVRNQRDETKKAGTLSLESLKETILELKKSLNEADRKQRMNFKSTESSKASAKESDNQEDRGRKIRTKDNHQKNENVAVLTREADSDSRAGDRDTERFDLKKREQASKELDEKNARPKVWRTKRTEVNKDDGNPKLFHRAGFGAPYLEEDALKEHHDRKRRSKGTPLDGKRNADEDGNSSGVDEKRSMTILKTNNDNDANISEKKELNNLQGANGFDQASEPTAGRENAGISNAKKDDCQKPETAKSNVQLDVSHENLNAMENKLMRNEEKGESLRGNSLRTFESVTNELRPVSSSNEISSLGTGHGAESGRENRMQKTEENRENVGLTKGEQVIKVFEPQGRLYQNSAGTKEVGGTEPENEQGKLFQQPGEEKRSPDESGNINILVKSENKNMIKFSNDCADDKSGGQPSSCMLNVFNIKKKMILEHDDKPSKTISTLFNVKYEKAQVDEPVKATNKREENLGNDNIPFGNGVPDFERGKDKEVPYEDTPASTNDVKQRNADEKRLENSAESNKGLEQSDVNDKGSQNWFANAIRNQMGMTVDQGAGAGKPDEAAEKEKSANEEERLSDSKVNADSSNKAEIKDANGESKSKKRYHEIFIVPSGMDDRIMSDKYSQRRLLQYMEYSNDDVEDVDMNYDNKEEEMQQQVNEDKNDMSVRRKERSSVDSEEKSRGKVNIMIQDKLQKKKDPSRNRRRRNPNVIEYYDYDSDIEQEALSPTSEHERIKNNYEDKNPLDSDAGLVVAEYERSSQTCPPTGPKSNEQLRVMAQEEKAKAKYKMPKEQFLSPGSDIYDNSNKTEKSSSGSSSLASASSITRVKYTDEEESSGNQQPGSRLNEPIEVNEDKFLDSDTKYIVLNPAKYILKEEKTLDPGGVDDFLEDVQSVDDKKGKIPSSMEPWYEELKKIYDWSEDETKVKPRIKGDQRMHYGADDKLESNDRTPESLKDQAELPASHRETGKSEIAERNDPVAAASSDRYGNAAMSNVSHSNYFALKSTDDMFKGGSEQSNSTGEKLRGPSAIGTAAEWQTQKVNGVRDGAAPEKDAAGWSLTNRGQYIDTDSRSPYENRKYLESQFPRSRERAQNIDGEKQILISSGDLHESFVEPVEWIDDFDRNIRVRLSRSLKTIETSSSVAYADSYTIRQDKNVINNSIDTVSKATSRTDESKVDLATQPSVSVQQLLENDRVKRDAAFRYNALYDDVNQRNRDPQNMDYTRYLRNNKMNNNPRVSDTYDNVDDNDNEKHSNPNGLLDDYYVSDANDDYEKVARSASPKKKKHVKKKVQKQKRKGHIRESKKNRRKRRHHKKHSGNSKTKNHGKKHKKNVSKNTSHHTNVKKSKTSPSDEKVHSERKAHHEKVKKKDASVDNDTQRRGISSLLIADNVEDESQMDSALHGELAGRIVEHIFDQVQKNDVLKVSLGPGLYQKHKTRDTVEAEKSYSQSVANDEIKHTEELLNKIMLLLNRLIFDEVQRKTCISLPPDLIEFLDWMLDVTPQERSMGQPPTLPLISLGVAQTIPQDKFLFQSGSVQETEAEINELYVKIQIIQKLIKEYTTLEEKDKAKVESIQDYLAKQLDLLLEYIESKEEAEKKEKSPSPSGEPKVNGGSVPQDQVGMSNTSNGNYSAKPDTFSTLMNVPNILKLNNENFFTAEGFFHGDDIDAARRGPRMIRSLGKHTKRNKKRKKRKKRKRKHGKHHKDASIGQSPYKDTVHKAVSQRQKREYLDNLFWDSSDSGYEEPLIYNFIDVTNVASSENDDKALKKLKENAVDKRNEDIQSLKAKIANDLKKDASRTEGDRSKSLTNIQSQIGVNLNKDEDAFGEDEPITGKSRLEDEILLLNKRQAWRKENEQQLEEIAFGEDMRKATADKVLFEKLTEIDKEKSELNGTRTQNCTLQDYTRNNRNNSSSLSDEDKLRMLEEKINVYADK